MVLILAFSGPHIFIANYNHKYGDVEKPIKNQGNLVKPSVSFNRGDRLAMIRGLAQMS